MSAAALSFETFQGHLEIIFRSRDPRSLLDDISDFDLLSSDLTYPIPFIYWSWFRPVELLSGKYEGSLPKNPYPAPWEKDVVWR